MPGRKRPKRCCLNTELLDAFYDAQDLVEADNAAKAVRLLRRGAKVGEGTADANAAAYPDPAEEDEPTVPVILSGIYNTLGEIALDAVLEKTGQRRMAGAGLREAKSSFETSVKYNTANSAAWLSLAGIHRDAGDLQEAMACYKAAAAAPPPELLAAGEWADAWVSEPYASCRPIALYHIALLHAQRGRHASMMDVVRAFGVRYVVSEEVWAAGRRGGGSAAAKAIAARQAAASPVTLSMGVVDEYLQKRLVEALSPTSGYWQETGYSGRGYFSWYYDPEMASRTIVESVIGKVILESGLLGEVKATEWWVHTRLPGRDIGHQLHFDTEEKTLEATGEIVFPLKSVVVYLTGCSTGGMTMVFDQSIGDTDPAVKGWGAHPQDGAVLYFPGNRLHGVLPACHAAAGTDKTQRLTLMIALWGTKKFTEARRGAIGPQAELPEAAGWVDALRLTAEDRKHLRKDGARKPPTPLRVESFKQMWTCVEGTADGEDVAEIPKSIDQRFFMRHLDFKQVLLDDHCGKHEDEESCEEEAEELEECEEVEE